MTHVPFIPAGNPEKVAPVAPLVIRMMLFIGEPTQTFWSIPGVIVFNGMTSSIPDVVAKVQPPIVSTIYVNVPLSVGDPLIIKVSPDQLDVIPWGNPVTFTPVATVVYMKISVSGEFIQTVWSIPDVIVFNGITWTIPVVVTDGQPPNVSTV